MTSRATGDASFRVIEIISNGKSDTLPHSPTASRVYGVGIGSMVRNAGRAGGGQGQAARAKGNGQTVCGVGWVGGLLLFVLCCVCDPAEKFSSFSRNSWLT